MHDTEIMENKNTAAADTIEIITFLLFLIIESPFLFFRGIILKKNEEILEFFYNFIL